MNIHNEGVFVGGDVGKNAFRGSRINSGNNAARGEDEPGATSGPLTDLAVLTVLPQEARAMIDVFRHAHDYRTEKTPTGVVHRAAFDTEGGGRVDAVLAKTLDRGQRSATAAYANLRRAYRPAVVALVGIAGGIDPKLDIGDVVIANQVVYYDERRETPDGPVRRGEATMLPTAMTAVVNDLFTRHNEPFTLPSAGGDGEFRVMSGTVGSGGAVITDAESEIRSFLQTFNEKCRVVETEAGGLVQAVREDATAVTDPVGWLVIRGVSDHADPAKGHRDHDLAARHAAAAFEQLVPLLK